LLPRASFAEAAMANSLRPMARDAKQKALSDVRRAQAKFERTQNQLGKDGRARRASFKRARKAGATLREIGEAANLHWSSVADTLGKK
jgi:hypothetical protein